MSGKPDQKLSLRSCIKVEYVSVVLCWVVFKCTGVPNKEARETKIKNEKNKVHLNKFSKQEFLL